MYMEDDTLTIDLVGTFRNVYKYNVDDIIEEAINFILLEVISTTESKINKPIDITNNISRIYVAVIKPTVISLYNGFLEEIIKKKSFYDDNGKIKSIKDSTAFIEYFEGAKIANYDGFDGYGPVYEERLKPFKRRVYGS